MLGGPGTGRKELFVPPLLKKSGTLGGRTLHLGKPNWGKNVASDRDSTFSGKETEGCYSHFRRLGKCVVGRRGGIQPEPRGDPGSGDLRPGVAVGRAPTTRRKHGRARRDSNLGGISRGASGPANWEKWVAWRALGFGGSLDACSHARAASGILAHKFDSIRTATRAGAWETYFTGYAWHLPHEYGETTRARLNETSWGGGIGRTYNDDDGDRHSVYFMAFADSHRAPQFNAGYAWQRYWEVTRGLSVGAGYLAFLFSREDVASHLPIPAILPCASVRFRNVELIGLFVPRVSRDIKGDVVFLYMRVPLGGAGRLRQP